MPTAERECPDLILSGARGDLISTYNAGASVNGKPGHRWCDAMAGQRDVQQSQYNARLS